VQIAPAATSRVPVISATVGIWERTTAPTTVAVAGNSVSIGANDARGSRAMASDSGRDQGWSGERGKDVGGADRHCDDERNQHRRSKAVNAARAAGARYRVADHDIDGEQRGVGDRQKHSELVARPLETDKQESAGDRDDEGGDVADGSHANERYGDGRDKLDRGDGRERQAVDGEIKPGIHERKRRPQSDDRRIESIELDENDRRLIEALDRNARTSTADLARLIGLSPQSTSDRVKRLEDLGVIAGFTIRLDPTALGLGIGAYIRIRPAMGELQHVSQVLADIPDIIECDRVTGEDCFVAKVLVPRVDDLERVIDRLLPFAQNTSIIQSSPVRRRQLSLRR
jgi:Lrp/AsnC family transcriptional regulator, leucine-responsive regulatory protein